MRIKKSSHYAGSFYVCFSTNLRRDQMDLGPKTGSQQQIYTYIHLDFQFIFKTFSQYGFCSNVNISFQSALKVLNDYQLAFYILAVCRQSGNIGSGRKVTCF